MSLRCKPASPSTQGTSRRLEVAEKGTAKANHRMKAPPFAIRLMCLKGRRQKAVGEDAPRHVKTPREPDSHRSKGKERLRRAAGSRPSAHLNFVERGNPHGVPALQGAPELRARPIARTAQRPRRCRRGAKANAGL